MLTNQRQGEVKIPNPCLRKIIQVAQQMELPREEPHWDASPLGRLCYSSYYMSAFVNGALTLGREYLGNLICAKGSRLYDT